MSADINIKFWGLGYDIGNEPTPAELTSASANTLETLAYKVNIGPLLVPNDYTDTNENKFSNPSLRYKGLIELDKEYYPSQGTTQTGLEFYPILNVIKYPYLYITSNNYPVEINDTTARRIVINSFQTEKLNGGSIKLITIEFEFGGIL